MHGAVSFKAQLPSQPQKQNIWPSLQLHKNLGEPLKGPTPMYEDNEGCEALATNDITSANTKHIDIRHHFVRDLVKSQAIEIVLISTSEMLADILTKNTLPTGEHKKHTDRMLSGTYRGPTGSISWGSVDIHSLTFSLPPRETPRRDD